MKWKPLFFTWLLLPWSWGNVIWGQADLRSLVQPVYDGPESTALSIFDTPPESPDGTYLSFVLYPEIVRGGHRGPEVKAYVMVRHRRTGDTRRLCPVWVTNHNGANALWVNDTLLAVQVDHLKGFEVFDVQTGRSLWGRIKGELGHKAHSHQIFYSQCNQRLQNLHPGREPYPKAAEGIWRLNLATGHREQLATKDATIEAFTRQNPEITGNEVMLLHVEPNPREDRLLFDYRHKQQPGDKRHQQLQGIMRANGSGIRWVPKRPMHVVWYDDTSMLGVDVDDPEKKIYRYDLSGKELELLAGPGCHLGASPDRRWYAGEQGYYWAEPDGFTRVYLYEKGEAQAKALLDAWKNQQVTWGWVAHVNPSFSADSERLYFIRAVDGQEKFEAVYIDLIQTSLWANKKD